MAALVPGKRPGLLLALLLWLLMPALPGATPADLYDQIITAAAQRHGLLPPLVKAVIKCESDFNPRAQSPRGAQGLMQLIPSTQAMLGVNDPFDPQENVAGGSRYLALLKQMFNGDLRLTLAAYNAGPQRVIDAGYSVPAIAETQQYVRCVQASYERYSQPDMLQALPLAVPAPDLTPERRSPGAMSPPRLTLLHPGATRQNLAVQPVRLSSQVAQIGQHLSVFLEAINTGPHPARGVIMLHYPAHAVSFLTLQGDAYDSPARTPAPPLGSPTAFTTATALYQLRWSRWQSWAPGEQRSAMITLVPRIAQDITLHVSVSLESTSALPTAQHWSTSVRIPAQAVALREPYGAGSGEEAGRLLSRTPGCLGQSASAARQVTGPVSSARACGRNSGSAGG
ncbi:MAG: lytic transglycosylase domain-containing protein [Candidatus Tectimicrobiota bacterium]